MNNLNAKTAQPSWLKVRYNPGAVSEMEALLGQLSLHTVCKEANCPNMGECYQKKTATFMILGRHCTRNCRFCNVEHAAPSVVDNEEPMHVAQAAAHLGLCHVVVTSVTRDDLPDGGAEHFAKTITAIRKLSPNTTIEVLIPDLKGDEKSLNIVLEAKADVVNHNIETVKRLYDSVRPEAIYERSLAVLEYLKRRGASLTKTGIMLGLGETETEVYQLMDDVRKTGCDILTIGQYLQPSPAHAPLVAYITPEEFEKYRIEGMKRGFRFVASGPLVRSSYQAAEALKEAVL